MPLRTALGQRQAQPLRTHDMRQPARIGERDLQRAGALDFAGLGAEQVAGKTDALVARAGGEPAIEAVAG